MIFNSKLSFGEENKLNVTKTIITITINKIIVKDLLVTFFRFYRKRRSH